MQKYKKGLKKVNEISFFFEKCYYIAKKNYTKKNVNNLIISEILFTFAETNLSDL